MKAKTKVNYFETRNEKRRQKRYNKIKEFIEEQGELMGVVPIENYIAYIFCN